MVSVSIEYTGDLHCDAVHGPSHAKIATDAPTDNKGKGEAFSPTDLVATALGTCMSTILAMAAQEHGLDVKGMTVNVSKEMSKDAPRRIIALPSEVHIPLLASTPQRALLEHGAQIVASLSTTNFGVEAASLPQVIFSFGTAPE